MDVLRIEPGRIRGQNAKLCPPAVYRSVCVFLCRWS